MKKKSMKKLAAAAIVAASLSMISACGKKDENPTEASETEETSESADEQTEEENVRPENLGTVTLGEYKGVEIETEEPHTVSDDEVENYIQMYVLPAHKQSVEDEIVTGDTVNIDYVGSIDGVEFDGGSAEGYDLTIGSGRFIDGFEDGLIGYKKGDKVDVNVTFPDPYENNPDLAGKPALFEVTVNDVKRTPAELTDEIAAEADPEVTTAAEYRRNIKSDLQESADFSSRQNLSYYAIEKVVENSTVEPSEEGVRWALNELMDQYEAMVMQSYGIGLEDMLGMTGQSREDLEESFRASAEDSVKQILVAEAIAEAQNMVVTDKDIEKFADDMNVTVDMLHEYYTDELINENVLQQKAIDYVIDNAVIKYTSDEPLEEESASADGTDAASSGDSEDNASEQSTAAESGAAEGADTAAED